MRKYLLADITKAVESEAEIERKLRIKHLMDEYDIKEKDAEKIVDEYDDYSIQDLVAKAIKNYSIDLKDLAKVKDYDIEEVLEVVEAEGYSVEEANRIVVAYQEEKLDSWQDAIKLERNGFDQADWAEVVDWAELLGIEPEGIEEDDFNNLQQIGAAGELDSESGLIQFYYNIAIKAYVVYMYLFDPEAPNAGTDVMYRLEPDMMQEWIDSDSKGLYYNYNIRGNAVIEDPAISCGCGPNPCEASQIDDFKSKYNSLK